MTDGETTPRHMPALDGLRGVAILLVIPHNADRFEAVHDWTMFPGAIAHGGWIGVQLFFVLSGFLITTNLLDSLGSPRYYQAFYARRVLRIFPLYYLALVFFLFILPRVVTLSPEILQTYRFQPWLWVFLSNWVQSDGRMVYWFSHFWSLAVEEQFYLVWPLLIACTGERRLWRVCLIVIGCTVLARCALLLGGQSPKAIYEFTVSRMDALACGALAAVLFRSPAGSARLRRHGAALLVGGAGLGVAVALGTHMFSQQNTAMIVAGYTLLAAAFTVALLVAAVGGASVTVRAYCKSLEWAPLRSAGRLSYCAYIVHLPIAIVLTARGEVWFRPLGSGAAIAFALLVMGASFAVAWLSFHLIEKHFLALKRYFVP